MTKKKFSIKIDQIFFFIKIWQFLYQSKALVELMLFLKTLKVMQSDYMTKNKKAYIAYNAYTKKMYALQKKMYAFLGVFDRFMSI
jgi:hypothetical protein